MSDWQNIETAPAEDDFLVRHRERIRQVCRWNGPGYPDNWVVDAVGGKMWAAYWWLPLPGPEPLPAGSRVKIVNDALDSVADIKSEDR